MRTALISLLALVPTLAHADCPVDDTVSVTVSCSAELIGGNSKVTYSEASTPSPLSVTGGGKLVTLQWANHTLLGELTCSGKSQATMDWGLSVRLLKRGQAAPLADLQVSAADASSRKGKPPLVVTSYEYLTPAVSNPTKAKAKLTRVDYQCQLEVN